DELGAVQRLDQARTFMALVVSGGLGGIEGDLGEGLAARLFFHGADRVLGVLGFPEGVHHAVRARAQTHVLDEVEDDPVDRHGRHRQEGDEHHPADRVHVLDHVREAHLLERSGVAASGGGDVSGFLQHDAYLLDVVVLDKGCSGYSGLQQGRHEAVRQRTKSTGTRTRPATATPSRISGLKRHLRAASMAARSRSRLRLDFSTDTLVTLPDASTSMTRMTWPVMPARRAAGGYLGGFMLRDDGSTLAPMLMTGAGGAGGVGGGAGVSIGDGSSKTTGGSSGGGGSGVGCGGVSSRIGWGSG